MQQIVSRIVAQLNALARQYPEAAAECGNPTLNAGAAESGFSELENVLGYELPEDFKALYRAADGEADGQYLLLENRWLPIADIIAEYRIWKQLHEEGVFILNGKDMGCEPEDAGIKPDYWWNPKWIPLTADGAGNGMMIDLDPAPNGTAGQVIQMWHDDAAREKIAGSLRELFEQYAQDLENGLYVLDKDCGLISKSKLAQWRKLKDRMG